MTNPITTAATAATTVEISIEAIAQLREQLGCIERQLEALVARQAVREWYSTEEFARLVGKAEFTVREWARLGRVRAEKRRSGRGPHAAWVVSHDELLRYRREGLLPDVNRRPA